MRHLLRTDFWLVIGFAIAMILLTPSAWASGPPDNRPPDNRPPEHNTNAGSESQADATAISGALAGAAAGALAAGTGGEATANGGAGGLGGIATSESRGGEAGDGGDASNDGNAFRSSSSNFYVSRSLPASANPCITSNDAGGGGKSAAGFLGIQILDDNCWKNTLAGQEKNAPLKALLKCGAKKFRKSVAYDQPPKTRQAYCVGFVTTIFLAEIALELDAMAKSHKRALEIIAAQPGGAPTGK